MSETILITGGAGFIGSHLTETLLASGFRVVVVDNLNSYYSSLQKKKNLRAIPTSPNYRFYRLDIRNLDALRRVFNREKPGRVIHLASEVGVRPSFAHAAQYFETNVQGTYGLLELAREARVKQCIFTSSSSVYGKRAGKRSFSENDPLAPISPYAATKQAAELICRFYALQFGLKMTVLRLFTVYGPRNRPDMAAYQFVRGIDAGRDLKLFGNNVKRDFTYVDDIVDGIVKALQRPFDYEIINLGNSSPVSVFQLVKLIEHTLGKGAKIKLASLPAGDVPLTFANITKAKKLLGWRPQTPLFKGIKNLVHWYQER